MPEIGFLGVPDVESQIDTYSCWAAAMHSWLKIVRPKRQLMTQSALLGWAEEKKLVTEDGALLVKKGILALAKKFRMGVKPFPNQNLAKLTGKFIFNTLAKKGHVLMAYSFLGVGHAVVVYGMVRDGPDEKIYAMDPSNGGGYTYDTLEEYKEILRDFILAWPLP